ncbi:hypothetical protein B566_EDAN012477 [Ephemera danica]|nr:hypothetical protein B566_EDAN012477 [Ephemera danica]
MGYHTNIQLEENSDYNNAITELSTILQRRFITPWLKPDLVFNATSLGRRHKRCVRTVHAFTDRVIEERRKELQRRLKSNGNFETLHHGHDTTAAGLSWCLYVLGHHPEVQERVVEEVRNVTAQEPDAGVTVLMNLYLLHRDPRFFPEPDRFIPERFLSHTEGPQHPFAYIPFSAGPRNCIGQRFAMLQLKILVAEVLLGFEVRSETAPERLNLMGELVLLNKENLRLWLTPRHLYS